MLNYQPLVTPAVAVAFLGGLWKILDGYLNHHATANADKISETLEQGFKAQTQTLANKIDEGNNKVVAAVLSLKQ
jgi:hypothetical protein